ncbi:hypothetical protein FBY06_114100 [Pseudomonas sp. SJZ085]|uniref:hypothetical protein n=1 Tax=unclassified Pseudomonas TaxID=196821 RepID=UPI00119C6930|nr:MULTISPECIES: hypothetical protein [unclassified Pseudomonas]TWC18642.1 hypothetical protein FBX99_114100 [Pseudomonas sp. SJZ074]TWC36425.1 hypothetical protein FBY06_114100 [Pseudomonas sp. SJZ085]
MEDEITIEIDGVQHTALYSVFDDTLTVSLPDGSQRSTELRGLNPVSAAKAHLRAYAGSVARQRK